MGCCRCSAFLPFLLLRAALGQRLSYGTPGKPNFTVIVPEKLSHRPWVYRFRNVLDHKQSARVRQLVLDAIVFFNDTARDGAVRPGARALNLGDPRRPRYRMQNERQLSLYFHDPPPVLAELYSRVARIAGVHPSSIEAIYHLYAPGALPANLHLDNFNKFLFPHRFASMSVFFDDAKDGGTVFPLLSRPGGPAVATEDAEVAAWHDLINSTRMDPASDGYAFRRVDEDERHAFRRRALNTAVEMCRAGRAAQEPVVPVRGSAYMWKNYLDNGEDDVRTIHAGCGSSADFKILGTFFVRDWPGPFQEHITFWDALDTREEYIDELQRQLEVQYLHSFRLRHLKDLYRQQREVMYELLGDRGAAWQAARQQLHRESLEQAQMDEEVSATIEQMAQRYSGADIPWTKVVPADRAF